jgi:hypothetical protein
MNESNRKRAGSQEGRPEGRATKRHLKCQLTDSELLVTGKYLAELNAELANLENAKARLSAEYGVQIKAKQSDIDHATQTMRQGYQMRTVDCCELLDTPEPGKKTVNRIDTGETVEVVAMTADEMQRELPTIVKLEAK